MNEAKPTRELQVPKQLDELQKALECLGKSIDELRARLSKAAMPEAPQEDSKGALQSNLCEYAENLSTKVNMVHHFRNIIVSLQERLEV